MFTLDVFPKNRQRFESLLAFLRQVVDICAETGAAPILNGSLAVLAYTMQTEMEVHDIDLLFPEARFPRMIALLEEKGIDYRVKEWHVLQILRDDLKIELDSMEYWMESLPLQTDLLQIADFRIQIVRLEILRELYRRGVEGTANQSDENIKRKYEGLKAKYDALSKVGVPESGRGA